MAEGGAGGSSEPNWRSHDQNLLKVCSICVNVEGKGKGKRPPSKAEAEMIKAFNPAFEKGSRFHPQGLCTTCQPELWHRKKGGQRRQLVTAQNYNCVPVDDTESRCTCWVCKVAQLYGNDFLLWKAKMKKKFADLGLPLDFEKEFEEDAGDGPEVEVVPVDNVGDPDQVALEEEAVPENVEQEAAEDVPDKDVQEVGVEPNQLVEQPNCAGDSPQEEGFQVGELGSLDETAEGEASNGQACGETIQDKIEDNTEDYEDVTLKELPEEGAGEQGKDGEPFGHKVFKTFTKPTSPESTAEFTALIKERCGRSDSDIESKLAVAYTKYTENHKDETPDKWECPDRTIQIYNILESSGILDVATRLEFERMASSEDFFRVHTETLWNMLQQYKSDAERLKKKKKKERLRYNKKLYDKKTLFLNEHSIPAAFMGAGSVISAVDFVMAKEGVAFALPRPGRSPTLSVSHCCPCIVSYDNNNQY